MTDLLHYDAAAARTLLDPSLVDRLEPRLLAARDEVFQDVDLLTSGQEIPPEKQPLDAGFIDLPKSLLEDYRSDKPHSLVGHALIAANRFREELDRVVLLGIGGSYMGARALFEALCHPYHNELDIDHRHGTPRLYFEGNNLDNGTLSSLLKMLQSDDLDRNAIRNRWGVVVISKSGGTLETAVAFRLFRLALEEFYGADSAESKRYIVPVTGEAGKLRDLAIAQQYSSVLPIPDNVGGRFSVFTAVGLLPAAILGLDIERLLQGAADMTERFRTQPLGENPVLDYTAICHLLEAEQGMSTRVLSTWGSRLEAVGLWYDQLLAESLGKEERGALPLTVVNTRDLHSRGQQHQEGRRDKLITNLIVRESENEPLALPESSDDQDQLNRFQGKTVPELLDAAIRGTNKAYADAQRPTADIILPRLDEYAIGQLLQMFMLATVLEGRLIGINPYGQPGVEAYKTNMTDILIRG